MAEVDQDWLDIHGLAEYLKISKETVYRMVYAKQIPFHRLGKLYRFNKTEVTKWLQKK